MCANCKTSTNGDHRGSRQTQTCYCVLSIVDVMRRTYSGPEIMNSGEACNYGNETCKTQDRDWIQRHLQRTTKAMKISKHGRAADESA